MMKFFARLKRNPTQGANYELIKNEPQNNVYSCNEDTDRELVQQVDKIAILESNKALFYPKQKIDVLYNVFSNLVFYKSEEDSYIKDDLEIRLNTNKNCIEVSTVGMYELLTELANVDCITTQDLANIGVQFKNSKSLRN